MSNLQIFKNESFGEVRVTEVNGEPYFCLADVCRALDLRQGDVRQRLDEGVVSTQPLSTAGGTQMANFVNEDGLYDVILDSRKPEARRFRKWVTKEVLPSIRKHGTYMTDGFIERTLNDPDYLMQVIKQWKVERQERMEAEAKNKRLKEENTYKTQIIEGLTEDIPLAEKRQRIVQIMNKTSHGDFGNVYRLLYNEFDKKFHINVGLRMSKMKYEGWNYLDYVEKEMHMIPELYELACKLFESDYNKLIESWGRTIKSAKIAARRGS